MRRDATFSSFSSGSFRFLLHGKYGILECPLSGKSELLKFFCGTLTFSPYVMQSHGAVGAVAVLFVRRTVCVSVCQMRVL